MAEEDESDKGGRDPLLVAVGARVRSLREASGVAQADFARAAGISLQYLWRVETGRQNLNLTSISRFALALDRPMAALLDGIEASPASLARRPYSRKPADSPAGEDGLAATAVVTAATTTRGAKGAPRKRRT